MGRVISLIFLVDQAGHSFIFVVEQGKFIGRWCHETVVAGCWHAFLCLRLGVAGVVVVFTFYAFVIDHRSRARWSFLCVPVPYDDLIWPTGVENAIGEVRNTGNEK